MSAFTRKLAALMLALYVLASMHCVLEAVPGFEFLKTCCFVESSSPAAADCEQDGCKVEKAQYRQEEQGGSLPQAQWILDACLVPTEPPLLQTVKINPSPAARPPPELLRRWQFICRTARLPRAPSYIV
ncbi:MAG: hypothetical protein N3J91_09395 [Verrucomicrobiae bacterium]|nr:hypothetical protein [Verrucomicrobiae bacterium]